MNHAHTLTAALAVVISLAAPATAAPPALPDLDAAKRSTLFTAVAATFDDGKTGFATCAAVVVDAKERRAAVPMQCVAHAGDDAFGCISATLVPTDIQVANATLRSWRAAGHTCRVVERDARLNMALIEATRPFPKTVTAATLSARPAAVGAPVYTVGFPLQIPLFLARGHVGARLARLHLDNAPEGFESPLFVISGAYTQGSSGAGVYDHAGALVGIVFADLYAMDGAAAIPATRLQTWLKAAAAR